MNDIRRTVLWVIFGFSMVLLWDQWQVHNGNKATFFPAQPKQIQTEQRSADLELGKKAGDTPSLTSSSVQLATTELPSVRKELIEVETDVLKVSFDTEGGTLTRAELVLSLIHI